MSFPMINWVRDVSFLGIQLSTQGYLYILPGSANDANYCFTPTATIIHESGLGERYMRAIELYSSQQTSCMFR